MLRTNGDFLGALDAQLLDLESKGARVKTEQDLNPLRAKLVEDVKGLSRYPYSGRSALIGSKNSQFWNEASGHNPQMLGARTREGMIADHRPVPRCRSISSSISRPMLWSGWEATILSAISLASTSRFRLR
jgi:hypothetical protein